MGGQYIPVSPNETVVFGGWAYLESGSATHESWQLVARDSNYNAVAFASSSPGTPSSAWTYQVGTYTVGSGVAYVQIYSEVLAATSPTVARFDDAFVTAGTQYYHQDQLSNRLITDVNGNDIGEQGHFPFGESWYAAGTTTNWQFATYERDAESGNDYAVQRYYPNRLGRFNSADPLGGDIGDPQTLNRYAYVRNNPLNLADPTGMDFLGEGGDCDIDCGGDPCEPFGCFGPPFGGGREGPGSPVYDPPRVGTDPNTTAGDPDPNGPFSGPIWQETDLQIPSDLATLILPMDPACEFIACGNVDFGSGFLNGASWGACVQNNRLDSALKALGVAYGHPKLGQIASDVTLGGTVASLGNLGLNLAVGKTGPGIGGTGTHWTTWQHKLGSALSTPDSALPSRLGRLAGRAAYYLSVGTLLFEGGYDAITMGRCALPGSGGLP